MATFGVNKNLIAVACGANTIVLNLNNNNSELPSVSILEPPFVQGQHSDNLDECEKDNEVHHPIVAQPAKINLASFSSCNKWLVLCSSNKQLSLWNTKDWSLLSNRVLARSASSVKFTPSGLMIIVADKSGDTYQYSVENPFENGTLILGHLSMLLDVVVTPDERYVITCDRDEKIRVSNFPNAYNIHSYCLGHEQFVTHIDFLPHDSSILLSGSGDGTVKCWEYSCGKELCTVNCSEHWSLSNTKHLNRDSSEFLEIFPIKTFSSCQIDDSVSIVCALLSGAQGCTVFKICSKSKEVQTSFIQVLNFDVEPWDACFISNEYFWILVSSHVSPVVEFVLKNSPEQLTLVSSSTDNFVSPAATAMNKKSGLFCSVSPPSPMTVLYKRKFDNVQEYHERKKIRQMAGSKTRLCSEQEIS